MSVQDAKNFRRALQDDAKLSADLAAKFNSTKVVNVTAFANDHGYSVSDEDLIDVWNETDGELSDAELELVSAGANSVGCSTPASCCASQS